MTRYRMKWRIMLLGFIFGEKARGHGLYWRIVMGWLGLRYADRCHEYSLEGVKHRKVKKPYRYICGCFNRYHDVTKGVHHKIQVLNRQYSCKRCHQKIIYQGMMVNNVFVPSVKKPEPPIKKFDELFIPLLPQLTPSMPPPVTKKSPETTYKVVTKFINGVLTNVRTPISA